MTFTKRLQRWNSWYDRAPEEWRFQLVVWPLVAIGAINMALTIAVGFPFGLLLLLGIVAVAFVRVPYVVGWVKPGLAQGGGGAKIQIDWPWMYRLNRWYDGIPEFRRAWVIVAVLSIAGTVNMVLTINNGFSFGVLFLLALLALVAIRAPYVAGWLVAPPVRQDALAAAELPRRIAQDTTAAPLGDARASAETVTHEPNPPPT